jgi:betaine-aldehyde dehydrogenase
VDRVKDLDRIAVINPATEQVIGWVPAGHSYDVDRAVAAAHCAFDPTVSIAERCERVCRLFAEFERRLPDIAATARWEARSRLEEYLQLKSIQLPA